MSSKVVTIDGNEAAAYTAHKINEVIAIYPITPSSNMGEWADEWSAQGKTNIWGTVPDVIEMQSEGGASAAVHGALQTGALCTTFTASQGLLLMIPSMFKIAGELTPTVFHVSARSVATHALSIFGDHSDIMAVRSTGFGLISSSSIQEIMDFVLIAQAASLESRIPFVHFFDGFRLSHEVQKINALSDDQIRQMIDMRFVYEHRARAMNPEKPVIRGTSQNPDVFFQHRERINRYYEACPGIVQKAMDRFFEITGRRYNLFDYYGDPDAERIVVIMGSGAGAVQETVDRLTSEGEKVGAIVVRLFRPFASKAFLKMIPASTRMVAVLDRTKEPGAQGEPLYQDVVTALAKGMISGETACSELPNVIGGRYGLSSKDFTPAMVKGVFDEMKKDKPLSNFTVGINDDLNKTSIDYDPAWSTESKETVRCLFYGLGSDGTVSANKNSIKIIGEETDNYAQGYFVYDSKKAGAVTISHLRFGPKPIRSSYLVNKAQFIACHQSVFLERYDMLRYAQDGGIFLLNTQASADEAWDTLPVEIQQDLIEKKMRFYVIDAYEVAKRTGMGRRINTIMQTCFFAISGVLPREEAITRIKEAVRKSYIHKGEDVVQKNYEAIDHTLANLHEVKVPDKITSTWQRPAPVSKEAPEFVRNVLAKIIINQGDSLPVSAFPDDGTYPLGTTQWEKRNIALEIPVWVPELCIQCGFCSLVCPHAAIRIKAYDAKYLSEAPETFKSMDYKGKEFGQNFKYTVQVAPEDCTGCGLCVHNCAGFDKKDKEIKALHMAAQPPLRIPERENYKFFLDVLPNVDRTKVKVHTVKGSQFLQPLFEYSGACEGCGETPYLMILSQLFGDRAIIGNATGCSSIYGGNLPTTPWRANDQGRGPSWNNSLFEDAAEFSFGFRLTTDKHRQFAIELLKRLSSELGDNLVHGLINADQSSEEGILQQRQRVATLKAKLAKMDAPEAKDLLSVADTLIKRSLWAVGGDGWAYDIGYGGLDHVIASNRDINLLVLDTGVYSNTGGQCSKATPMGAVAKFAYGGKPTPRKDLGLLAMSYGHVYVAQIAFGAKNAQTVKALYEADSYPGPSLVIAYCHCIAHGIDMSKGTDNHQKAVDSASWILYRYDPRRLDAGKNPLQLDSKAPKLPVKDWTDMEVRFRNLFRTQPERAEFLAKLSQRYTEARWLFYETLSKIPYEQEADKFKECNPFTCKP